MKVRRSVSRPGSFIPEERAHCINRTGGWLRPSDVVEKRKIVCTCRESNHTRFVFCLAPNQSCCIDCSLSLCVYIYIYIYIYIVNDYNNDTSIFGTSFSKLHIILLHMFIYFNSLYLILYYILYFLLDRIKNVMLKVTNGVILFAWHTITPPSENVLY
jgi:hypothetical protein